TGDPESKTAKPGQMLGSGDPGYTIPAEFVYPKHFHRYGALAAARTGDNVNPERRSSGSQFYIVTGQKYPQGKLNQLDLQIKQRVRQQIFDSISAENRSKLIELRRQAENEEVAALRQQITDETERIFASRQVGLTPQQREAYETIGGTPHLDGQYTVFGQVVDGMDVIEKIQSVETNSMDRPTDDIKIVKVTIE
ncbi:MAG: peptidylprolyl isomerase, partial [Muribaculum sp.]|nr:peptidylprolyl isomerase [Muribaculum sp.]